MALSRSARVTGSPIERVGALEDRVSGGTQERERGAAPFR